MMRPAHFNELFHQFATQQTGEVYNLNKSVYNCWRTDRQATKQDESEWKLFIKYLQAMKEEPPVMMSHRSGSSNHRGAPYDGNPPPGFYYLQQSTNQHVNCYSMPTPPPPIALPRSYTTSYQVTSSSVYQRPGATSVYQTSSSSSYYLSPYM